MEGGGIGERVSVHHLHLLRGDRGIAFNRIDDLESVIKLKSLIGEIRERRRRFKPFTAAWERRDFETLPGNGRQGSRWDEPSSRARLGGIFFHGGP